MTLEGIEQVAVLGAGTMGHGIAEVAAIAGYDVSLRDIEMEFVEDGLEEIEWSLGKLVEQERLDEEAADAARERIRGVVDMAEAVGEADFVIEAVPERLDIKRDVFEEVSDHASADAIFASNTSSISISAIAAATDRPERFCGMHFFNPPVRMDLVEVIAGDETEEDVLETTEDLARDFGKTPVRVNKDSPGFIANRVLTPQLNEACWMVHEDEATIEAVDATAQFELGFPMGAFELADQVGLDVALDVLEYMHDELGDAYAPCPLLAAKVDNDELGRKTDAGFYDYADGGIQVDQDARDPEIAERLLAVMANEAAKLRGDDVASEDAIETALELGAGFPDGPIRLADEHGVEALVGHLETKYEETGAARYEPSEALLDWAAAGGERDREGAPDFEALRIEYPGAYVARLVIDRPHRMNAISPEVIEELPEAIERLEGEDDVRAVLVTGAGDRAFSAGADIGGMAAVFSGMDDAIELSKQGQQAYRRLMDSDLPVIAAIDGYCLGGGMELATAADLRIATERSTFSQPERDLGMLPGWGGTQRLIPIVGLGRAKEIVFTGEEYDAEEMASFGFVNEVMSNDEFDEAAVEYAETIAQGPPIAMAAAKRAMHFGVQDEEAGLEVEAGAFGRLTQTDDLNEGISAFLEDRDPEFEGA